MKATSGHRAILAGILCIGAFVRLYRLDLTWYFLDQVRDVSTGTAIASGQSFPLLGPLIGWTSARLGPLYFYLIAPPFLLSGAPLAGAVFAALASVLAIFLLYRFASDLFGPPVALTAAALFAVFPLAVVSSRVLWNPAFLPLFTVLLMRDLYGVVVKGRSRAIIGVFAWLAVLTQIHLSGAFLGVVALLSLLLWRPQLKLVHVLAGAAVFLALYGPYLAHEATHGFENTRAILGAATAGGAPGGERGLPAVVKNLLFLDRGVLAGFVVRSPWPPGFLSAFSILYAAEAVLFGLGLVLSVRQLFRGPAETRRSVGLLLLWLLVPVVLLGSRKTALWWYYFDILYPSQFIVAGIALAWLAAPGFPPAAARRFLVRGAAVLVLAIVIVQTGFQVLLQRRIDAQAEIVFDAPRFSVASSPSALGTGTLTTLPYGYRDRILRVLVDDFGLDAEGVVGQVHGSVLGLRQENEYLLHRLAARAPLKRPSDGAASHYLVVKAPSAEPASASRTVRVGPYRIAAYRPAIDYGNWSFALLPRADAESIPEGAWEHRELPAENLLTLGEGQRLAWRGALRIPAGEQGVRVAVILYGASPLEVTRAESRGGSAVPVGRRSWLSPSLYWTTEAVFDVKAAPGSDRAAFRFVVAGAGPVMRVDLHELAITSSPERDTSRTPRDRSPW